MGTILKMLSISMLIWTWAACSSPTEPSNTDAEKAETTAKDSVRRYGSVIKIKPEMLDQYKKLHAHPWPGVLEQITECNIRNYSIFLKDDYLFSYFEYVGNNFEADMAKMAQDSLTREWWKLTDPCQVPLETRQEDEWWASMEEVFHHD